MSIGGLLGGAFNGMNANAGLQNKQLQNQQLQQQLNQQKQQQAGQALAAQFLQQMSGAQPQGASAPTMSPISAQAGGAPPQGAGTPSPVTGGGSSFTPESLIKAMQQSNAPDAVKMQAFQTAMATMNPYEKMQASTNMKMMQMDNQQKMLEERLSEMKREKDQWAQVQTALGSTRSADKAADRDSRKSIADEQVAGRKDVAAMKPAAQGAANPDATAIEKELTNSRSLLQSMLNNGRGPGKPEYDEEKKNYTRLQTELDNKRTKAKLDAAPASPQPQDADIAYLKANPTAKDAFDTHFGAGAAAKILGQ